MTDAQANQLDAVLSICSEVERHANAIDPTNPTAASVQNELIIDLAGGLRLVTKIVREAFHYHPPIPGAIIANGKPVEPIETGVRR